MMLHRPLQHLDARDDGDTLIRKHVHVERHVQTSRYIEITPAESKSNNSPIRDQGIPGFVQVHGDKIVQHH